MTQLFDALSTTRLQDPELLYVVSSGHYDPTEVYLNWSVLDVYDVYYSLAIRSVLES